MTRYDIESSALSPAAKWGEGSSAWERPLVIVGMVIGLIVGLGTGISIIQKWYFPCALTGVLLGGTLGGWAYHLLFTPLAKRPAELK